MASSDHVVDVSLLDYVLRVVEAVDAMIVLGLSVYLVAISSSYAQDLTLFTSVWTAVVLSYYMISVHVLPSIYHWAFVLFLEMAVVAFYISSVATLGVLYSSLGGSADYFWEYNGALIALLVLCGIAIVLHTTSLAVFIHAARKHHQQHSSRLHGKSETPETMT